MTDAQSHRPRPPAWTNQDVDDDLHGLHSIDAPDLDEIPTATNWAAIPASSCEAEWLELREWVAELLRRFDPLDHHVIPPCWWRHNNHVEALVALRDHERVSFSEIAPATAPLDWFRALRDITTLLGAWTADLACDSVHQNPSTRLRPQQ